MSDRPEESEGLGRSSADPNICFIRGYPFFNAPIDGNAPRNAAAE